MPGWRWWYVICLELQRLQRVLHPLPRTRQPFSFRGSHLRSRTLAVDCHPHRVIGLRTVLGRDTSEPHGIRAEQGGGGSLILLGAHGSSGAAELLHQRVQPDELAAGVVHRQTEFLDCALGRVALVSQRQQRGLEQCSGVGAFDAVVSQQRNRRRGVLRCQPELVGDGASSLQRVGDVGDFRRRRVRSVRQGVAHLPRARSIQAERLQRRALDRRRLRRRNTRRGSELQRPAGRGHRLLDREATLGQFCHRRSSIVGRGARQGDVGTQCAGCGPYRFHLLGGRPADRLQRVHVLRPVHAHGHDLADLVYDHRPDRCGAQRGHRGLRGTREPAAELLTRPSPLRPDPRGIHIR